MERDDYDYRVDDNTEEVHVEDDVTEDFKKLHIAPGSETIQSTSLEDKRSAKKNIPKLIKKPNKKPQKPKFSSEKERINYFKQKYGKLQKLPQTDEEISYFFETYEPLLPDVRYRKKIKKTYPIFLKYTEEGYCYPPESPGRRTDGKYTVLAVPQYKRKRKIPEYSRIGEESPFVDEEFDIIGRKEDKDDEQVSKFFETGQIEFEGEQEEIENLSEQETASVSVASEEEEEEMPVLDEKDPWFLQNLKLNMIALYRKQPDKLKHMRIALENYKTLDYKTKFRIEEILEGEGISPIEEDDHDYDSYDDSDTGPSINKTIPKLEEHEELPGEHELEENIVQKMKTKMKKRSPSEKLHAETIDKVLYYNPRTLVIIVSSFIVMNIKRILLIIYLDPNKKLFFLLFFYI